jgi:hyperosmotically inducible periplasmic protein
VKTKVLAVLLLLSFAGSAVAQSEQGAGASDRSRQRIEKEVRYEILTLPRFDVFDNINYSVTGDTVTLQGDVRNPSTKADAERAVKQIEGVEKVVNNINVSPASPNDDRLRLALYRAIYGYSSLQRYAMPVVKPIRIIVNNGKVRLEGVVDNEADKNTAGIRAKGVPGTFEVVNNLRVVKDTGK